MQVIIMIEEELDIMYDATYYIYVIRGNQC